MKSRMTHKPPLLGMRETKTVPMFALHYPVDYVRFFMTEAGAVHLLITTKSIRQIVIAKKEHGIGILHLPDQPRCCVCGVPGGVPMGVEEVTEEDHAVVADGIQPVIGILARESDLSRV